MNTRIQSLLLRGRSLVGSTWIRTSFAALICAGLVVSTSGCGNQEFVSMGTAPVGGAFQPVGSALAETLNENKGENTWKVQAKGTKGSQENIRRLDSGELQLALSNAAITYFAVNGGGDWGDDKYEMRAIVTMAPNVAMFVTREDSGIKTIADLKGKKVVVGPAGAGFDMFVEPLLEAHGVKYSDFTQLNNNQNAAVDMLADGQADAAFLGGALPTASIQRACSEMDIHFIPFEEDAKKRLVADYPFFQEITVTKDKYDDLKEDYHGMNVGNMHLITSSSYDEEKVYQITKTLYENRDSIGHPVKKSINPTNAVRDTGIPFHAGAVRFYKEAGIWKEDEVDTTDEEASDDDSSDDNSSGDDSSGDDSSDDDSSDDDSSDDDSSDDE